MSEVAVLVVDDSAVARKALSDLLTAADPGLAVTVSADPLVALGMLARKRPDVIVLDLDLPRMDGFTFLARVTREHRIPVVVCSTLTGRGTEAALRALQEGAVDVVGKEALGGEGAAAFAASVRAAAQARPRALGLAPPPRRLPAEGFAGERVVVIGASTGGTEALRELLPALPEGFPPIAVVQHMPSGFTARFAAHLDALCAIEVREAREGDLLEPGVALIAPGDRHLTLVRRGGGLCAHLAESAPVHRHRPSVDVLFSSAARCAGADAVGVLLTGMGADGAEGMVRLRAAGATTLAQDEATSVVFGMPREAILRGAASEVVPLEGLASAMLRCARAPNGAKGES